MPTILPTYAHLKCRYLDYPVLCHGKHQFYERTASTHEKNASNYLVLFHPSFQKINTVFVCFFPLLWLSLYKQLQNIVPLIVSVHVQNPVLKICCSHLQVKTFLQRRWKIIIVPFIYSTTASFSFSFFFFHTKRIVYDLSSSRRCDSCVIISLHVETGPRFEAVGRGSQLQTIKIHYYNLLLTKHSWRTFSWLYKCSSCPSRVPILFFVLFLLFFSCIFIFITKQDF